jgi:HSP20 family molecular chaperone IbpA
MLAARPERVTFVVPGGAPEEIAITLHTDAVDGARLREVLLERVGGEGETP